MMNQNVINIVKFLAIFSILRIAGISVGASCITAWSSVYILLDND